MERRLPWALIVAWLLVGGSGYLAIARVLDGRSTEVSTVIGVEAAGIWALAWVASLIPRMVTLTALRIVVPAAVLGAVATFVVGGSVLWSTLFTVTTLAALAALAHPVTIDAFVDGSSYGPERRFALRTPPLIALVAIPPVWLLSVAVVAVPPLAVTGAWIVAVVVGIVWAVALPRVLQPLHLPARRWVVFVPAGMVLSDPLSLTDRVLFPRRDIAALGPAFADTDATELSAGALGLALQIDLDEPFALPLRADTPDGERIVETDRIVFSVLRPGALLATAAERRVAVGETRSEAPTCVHHAADPEADESQTAVPLPRTRSSR